MLGWGCKGLDASGRECKQRDDGKGGQAYSHKQSRPQIKGKFLCAKAMS